MDSGKQSPEESKRRFKPRTPPTRQQIAPTNNSEASEEEDNRRAARQISKTIGIGPGTVIESESKAAAEVAFQPDSFRVPSLSSHPRREGDYTEPWIHSDQEPKKVPLTGSEHKVSKPEGPGDKCLSEMSTFEAQSKGYQCSNEKKKKMKRSIHLPIELLEEVFLRCPIQDIQEFKTSCKQVNESLNSSIFASRHWNQGAQTIFLHCRGSEVRALDITRSSEAVLVRNFNGGVVEDISQSNGVLLSNIRTEGGRRLALWSCSQRKLRWIDREVFSKYDYFALGRDSMQTFKVLRFRIGMEGSANDEAEVYDIAQNTWSFVMMNSSGSVASCFVPVADSTYWLSLSEGKRSVQSFNFTTERFKRDSLPLGFEKKKSKMNLSGHRDKLCLMFLGRREETSIWFGKKLSNGELEWSKHFDVSVRLRPGLTFYLEEKESTLCCCSEEVVDLFNTRCLRVSKIHTQTGTVEHTDSGSFKSSFHRDITVAHTPSLVKIP